MTILELLYAYQGIVAALLGVIVTMITNVAIKKLGRIHISALSYKTSYLVMGGYGDHYYVNAKDPDHKRENYHHGKVEIEIALFNNSDEPKGLKNIKICLLDRRNRKLFESVPKDEGTETYSAGQYHVEFLKIINLPSKTMINYDLYIIVDVDNLESLKKCEKVVFEYEDHRDRKKRKKIIKNFDE